MSLFVIHSWLRGEEKTHHRKCRLFLKDTGLRAASSAGMILEGRKRSNTLRSTLKHRQCNESTGNRVGHSMWGGGGCCQDPQGMPSVSTLDLGPSTFWSSDVHNLTWIFPVYNHRSSFLHPVILIQLKYGFFC